MHYNKFTGLTSCLIVISVAALLIISCNKEEGVIKDTDIEEYVANCETIAIQADEIIQSAIVKAFEEGTDVDPYLIASAMAELDLVNSAEPSESGISIAIEHNDGSYSNVLLAPWHDDRMFIVDSSGVSSSTNYILPDRELTLKGSLERPEGNKALILAPFQHQFNDKLNDIASRLSSIGYQVTTVIDLAADLSNFRCDTLQQYDVIIVETHGLYHKNRSNEKSTLLATGERVNTNTLNNLSAEERKAIGSVAINGRSYFAASVQWLELTKNGEFSTSWFCANGCETSKTDFGSGSLSAFLLNNGVGGFTGFDGSIPNPVAKSVVKQLLYYMSNGDALKTATNKIKNDRIFRIVTKIRLIFDKESSEVIDQLDAQVRANEPFYINKENPFPYNHCRFSFFARASYNNSSTGSYNFAFAREVEAFGSLDGNKFTGSYDAISGEKTIDETIEITLDLSGNLITEFTITGKEKVSEEEYDNWEINSSDTDFPLNTTNGYGYSSGSNVGDYVGNVTYKSVYQSAGTSETVSLTGIIYDDDSELEIQFSELEE